MQGRDNKGGLVNTGFHEEQSSREGLWISTLLGRGWEGMIHPNR